MALLTTCQASFQSMKDYEDVKDDVESLKENIHECYSEISKTSEQIQHTVRETYLTKSELETIQKDFQASITQNSKRIQSRNLFNYNIFLIGFMGAGKSTISDYLKNVLAMDVVEMDQCIVERQGMSISDIFETYGEEYFRELETNLLIEMQSRSNVVVSCGGGVPMRERNVTEMKKNGRVVLLTAKPETILERVKDNHDRPLLENNKNVSFIADLLEKRRAKYEAAADIVVETDGKSELEICEEMIHRLREADANK